MLFRSPRSDGEATPPYLSEGRSPNGSAGRTLQPRTDGEAVPALPCTMPPSMARQQRQSQAGGGGRRRRGLTDRGRPRKYTRINVDQIDYKDLALLRRFITGPWIPQKYSAQVRGQHAALLKQNFNPFVFKLTVDFSADRAKLLDRRLGLAAGLLLSAIEGREG